MLFRSDGWMVTLVLSEPVDGVGAVGGGGVGCGTCVVGIMREFRRKAVLRRTEMSESVIGSVRDEDEDGGWM